MTTAIVVALIAATPPTLAALLAYLQARATNREQKLDAAAGLKPAVESLAATVNRVEASVGRIDGAVADIRERVARLEGEGAAQRRTSA